MTAETGFRIEKDSLGEFKVPNSALYGAQTARAVDNFPVSFRGIGRHLIRAMGQVKFASASVNEELGLIEPAIAAAIRDAAQEVMDGKLDEHFPVDVFQTGSGTSSNMNTNEVISNRAIQKLGGVVGSKAPVHPNDHVNFGQSSNDSFPTAIRLATIELIDKKLIPALTLLEAGLSAKAKEFDGIVKIGRTHLQDATPIRLGQEFSGYASQIAHGIQHLRNVRWHLAELPQGGTAVGTGINTHAEFGARIAKKLSAMTGAELREAPNHFEAQGTQDATVAVSGVLKTIAVSLIKIANDIRWLACGPRLGLAEIKIPAVQPGSSIMPGKVNPVICESMLMVCGQVIGNDAAVTFGGLYGNFELNTMMPLIGRNLLESTELLANASVMFAEKLVAGIEADVARIESMNENSLSLATALAPHIGYDKAADIAKTSYKTGKTVRQLAFDGQVMSEAELNKVLDLKRQTEPGL